MNAPLGRAASSAAPGRAGPSSAAERAGSSGSRRSGPSGPVAFPVSDPAEWHARLLARAAETGRAREAKAAERRAKAARRQAGMTARHAWRQLHLDARAAEAGRRRAG